jgi:hypothetical protein
MTVARKEPSKLTTICGVLDRSGIAIRVEAYDELRIWGSVDSTNERGRQIWIGIRGYPVCRTSRLGHNWQAVERRIRLGASHSAVSLPIFKPRPPNRKLALSNQMGNTTMPSRQRIKTTTRLHGMVEGVMSAPRARGLN